VSPIRQAARVEARLEPFRWAWAEENAGQIAENWARRSARASSIFDGRVLMVAGFEAEGDLVRARFFETSYSRLIAHVDFGFPDTTVANGFAMGALRSRDGAYLLGLMAAHTANAGRLYFPAGTPDLSDVRPDGQVDLASSILREIEEETGLGADVCRLEPGWTIVRHGGRLAFLRGVSLALDAEEALARITRHLDAQDEPELAAIHLLRSVEEIDEARMPSFLPVYLRWVLGEAASAQR